ncbi:MAG: serine hydrolase domain-containing protein [Bacteroidota bacterium]
MGFFHAIKARFASRKKTIFQKDAKGIEKTDALFQSLAGERIPGMSVTVFRKGEIVLQRGYGYADVEERVDVQPRKTVFRVASISKCITALAFGKMVEEGILNWEDALHHYVPYYPKKKYDFTLKQLAAHTAGIRGYRGKEYALNRNLSIKDSIAVFKDDPLVFEPGQGYLYNSFDFVLLSLAMQEACGMPFEDYVKYKILRPLGMHTTFHPREEAATWASRNLVMASHYTKRRGSFVPAIAVDNFYKLAGGGYLSTSEDIAKMGQAILQRQFLAPEGYEQLLSSQYVRGKPTYYGLGFQVSSDTMGRPFVGHIGNSVGAYTNFFVYPEEDIAMAILINCTDPKIQKDLDKIVNEILKVEN